MKREKSVRINNKKKRVDVSEINMNAITNEVVILYAGILVKYLHIIIAN